MIIFVIYSWKLFTFKLEALVLAVLDSQFLGGEISEWFAFIKSTNEIVWFSRSLIFMKGARIKLSRKHIGLN